MYLLRFTIQKINNITLKYINCNHYYCNNYFNDIINNNIYVCAFCRYEF